MSICYPPRPIFAKPTHAGLGRASPGGNGISVCLRWDPGYSPDSDYQVGYNIYFSSSRDDVFSEGVKYFTLVTEVAVSQFIPGDTNYFAIRATLWNPVDMNSTGLTSALTATDAYVYPETILSADITETDTQIPVLDVTDFPTYGIIKIGGELIKYYFINSVTNTILTTPDGRGYLGTEAKVHTIDGYDGYVQRDPTITYFLGFEDPNEVVVLAEPQFRPPLHAFNEVDGYKRKSEDLLTTDLTASDETNEDIPGYDYSGYHQTSMLDYFSGKCIGSYHGGEYGCACPTSDQYGNALEPGEENCNVKIRGFNLQDANMRREEMLLETTGEPVVLVRRKWTGIRCACYRHNNQQPDGRCPTCFSTGFETGYEQYFNQRRSDRRILVRFDPTTDDLMQVDRGLTQEFKPTAWTLTVPAVKDRDFIIRFNEDGTDEFRYEILNVTRNKLLFSLSGGQKFQLQRVDKTDIIYQWRAIRDTAKFPNELMTSVSTLAVHGPHMHEIVINEDITDVSQINQTTSYNADHNHPVISGIVQPVLGHTHNIVI
jgi:hypothetical protein